MNIFFFEGQVVKKKPPGSDAHPLGMEEEEGGVYFLCGKVMVVCVCVFLRRSLSLPPLLSPGLCLSSLLSADLYLSVLEAFLMGDVKGVGWMQGIFESRFRRGHSRVFLVSHKSRA